MERRILIFSAVIFFVVQTSLAQAQGLVPCKGPDCDWCSLIQLIQNLINYAIYLGVLLGSIVFAYAGWTYMSMESAYISGYSGEGKEYARKLLTGVVIGMVCILGGWLVVDTLLKALVDDSTIGPWNEIQCNINSGTSESGSQYQLPTNPRPIQRDPYSDLGE